MDRLSRIVSQSAPGTGFQFRRQPYGSGNLRDFLRDVMAIANAAVDGRRYIIVGADFDGNGRKKISGVADKDFSGKPDYVSLAREYIEPELSVKYRAIALDGKQVGVFEIGDCRDRPYMMRMDYSEDLRRGDAYMRVKDSAIKMGRRQLQTLFESRFRDTVSGADLELGFPGEIIHKHLQIDCCDLSTLPSAIASSKIQQLIKIQLDARNTGSTSIMARLGHARLFGADDPYVSRSPGELMQEMEDIRHKYTDQDREFLFETNVRRIQLLALNQGQQPVPDASLSLVLPRDPQLYVADAPPKIRDGNTFVERSADEIAGYPAVALRDNSIHIKCRIGHIGVGEPVEVFGSPLRICAGPGLRGRKFGVQYVLRGTNLRSTVKGRLRLLFR